MTTSSETSGAPGTGRAPLDVWREMSMPFTAIAILLGTVSVLTDTDADLGVDGLLLLSLVAAGAITVVRHLLRRRTR